MVRFAKQSYIGTRHMASVRKKSNSNERATLAKKHSAGAKQAAVRRNSGWQLAVEPAQQHFAVCVRNDGYAASLELRKLYVVLDDSFAEEHQMIRIIDESREDYLYPNSYFVRVDLPRAVERTLQKIA